MFDVLVLDSGEWLLGEELFADPWCVLIYHQRDNRANELHLWLPRRDASRSGDLAFRRYWMGAGVRWCVELPPDPDRMRSAWMPDTGATRLRFTTPSGHSLWADHPGGARLGDLTDAELFALLSRAVAGPFSRI